MTELIEKQHKPFVHIPQNIIQQLTTGKSQLKMRNKAFFDILKLVDTKHPSSRAIINRAEYAGRSGKKKATFTCTFEIDVLSKEEWVAIDLMPTSVALMKYSIVGPSKSTTAWIGARTHRLFFITNTHGVHTVTMEILCRYEKTRGKLLRLDIPISRKNRIEFTVQKKTSVQIYVGNSLSAVQKTEGDNTTFVCAIPPIAQLVVGWIEKDEEEERKKKEEKERLEKEKKEKEDEKKRLIINAEQHILHSVGDGVVISDAVFKYTILHGTKSRFDILVPEKVQVLSVEGRNVQKWEIVEKKEEKDDLVLELEKNGKNEDQNEDEKKDDEKKDEKNENENSNNNNNNKNKNQEMRVSKTIRVWLDTVVEGDYNLNVITELPMESSSGKIYLPVFKNLNVHRDKGWIGITGKTNSEINEKNCTTLAKIDVNELPEAMKQRSLGENLLFAYKFLIPLYNLLMEVIQHLETDVLIAVIDEAHIAATQTNSAMIFKCSLVLRNTQRQYLRMKVVDKNFHLWSTLASSKPVKPTIDRTNNIMIPLEKRGANAEPFTIEIIYVCPSTVMKGNGKIRVNFPLFDLPINELFITLFLPRNFKYSEFAGTLKEVSVLQKGFNSDISRGLRISSRSQERALRSNIKPQMRMQQQVMPQQMLMQNIMPQQMMMQQMQQQPQMMMQQQVMQNPFLEQQLMPQMDQLNSNVFDSFEPEKNQALESTTLGASGVGVTPVKVELINTGTAFYFEKFLIPVSENFDRVIVSFSEITKGFFQKRRISNLPNHLMKLLIFLIIFVYFWFILNK
ncbi:remodeling and spacing factor 1 [Anaeramoeba ignava]|uniref:Remodeling and spacing factor 1 n=1 Tax=Anaeramoeba ignava TaxID=1746090 RepID=A0A9Q0R413_ANAIG|nr:remodeling and spacing factor 1 [Anaeramoeba ignava]